MKKEKNHKKNKLFNRFPRSLVAIFITAIVIPAIVVVYFSFFAKSAEAAWFDDNWLYRAAVPISSHTAAENNVYVTATIDTATPIAAGKMQSNCGDIRFTKENGELLPYFINASPGCDNVATTIQVQFDSFPAGAQTIYIYYGNPSAPVGFENSAFATEASSYAMGTVGAETVGPAPVVYWKFDEAQGTTAQDSSKNNLDGTLNNTPTWQAESMCVAGKCLYFDGSNNENVSKSDDAKLDFVAADNFTVSAWAKRNGSSSANTIILGKASANIGSTYQGYKLYMDASGDFCFATQDGTNAVDTACTSGIDFDDDKWHLVQGVKTGTTKIELYIDGNLRASDASIASTGSLANAGTFYVGIDSDGAAIEWKGFIDEVKIYDFARSSAQVHADFSSRGSVKGVSAQMGGADQKFLSDGLVGYWKMDESSWNGTSGEVKDASGNGLNGTATGTPPTTATAKFGPGGSFNGSTDYVSVTDTTDSPLDFTTDYTISAWVKLDALPSTSAAGLVNKFALGNGGYEITISSTGLIILWLQRGGTLTSSSGSTVLTAGNWYHIVFATSAGQRRLYVNNALDPGVSGTFTLGANNTSLSIGSGDAVFGNKKIDGLIDEVRFYNRALSSKEVADLYSWAPGPVGYWKMDDKVTGDSKTIVDSSGNGNNATTNIGANNTSMDCAVAGKYGGGCFFDGVDDYISVAGVLTGVQTVSFWVKPSANTANMLDLDGGTHYITSDSNGTITATGFSSPTIYVNGISGGTLSANVWNYVSVSTATAFDSNSSFTIGEANGSFSGGIIDDVKIYNYTRTQKQVVSDMNAGHPAVGSPVGSAVAHWKFNEGYGTIANDSSINDNDLTLSSVSWTDSGKFGKAWNGTNAVWLSRTDDSDFDVTATDDYAISLWFKSDSADNPGAVEYLFNKANATTAGYAVYANTDGTVCFGIDDDTTWGPNVSSCTSSDIYDGTWHHLIAVRDTVADKILIYTDGVLKDSDTDSTTATLANSLSLYLGDRDGTDNGDEFTGDLDEVKVYRYALNSDDVKTEYNRGSSLVLGSAGDNSSYAAGAANQEYCVPGDATSCVAPVARWDFEEGSGGSANDSSGNGLTGTITGATWRPGKTGKGLYFDGNDYVTVSNNANLDIGTDFTVEAWIYPKASGNEWLVGKTKDADNGWILYYHGQQGFLLRVEKDGIFHARKVGSLPTTNKWYHLVGIYRSSTAKSYLYVNGVEITPEDAGEIVGPTTGTSLWTGSRNGSDLFFNGQIDNIRIFNYARSAAQIAYDYNRGKPVGHWKLDECQGATAYDSSGNSKHGAIAIGASGEDTVGTCATASSAWGDGATGKRNYSLKLDGNDDYATTSSFSPLSTAGQTTTNFSWGGWFYPTTGVASKTLMEKASEFQLTTDTNSVPICGVYYSGAFNNSAAPAQSLTLNAWNHAMCVYDGTNINTYLNGKLIKQSAETNTVLASSTVLYLGETSGGANFYEGQLDDIKIWNYPLTATQVRNDYGGGAINFAPTTGAP